MQILRSIFLALGIMGLSVGAVACGGSEKGGDTTPADPADEAGGDDLEPADDMGGDYGDDMDDANPCGDDANPCGDDDPEGDW